MELDLTPYDKALIIRLLTEGAVNNEVTDKEYNMLQDFCDALEHCDETGNILFIN